jgi:SAM-dependent methyltransferase
MQHFLRNGLLLKSPSDLLFHPMCTKRCSRFKSYDENDFAAGRLEAAEYLRRMEDRIDYRDKCVLDVGFGYGSLCVHLALNGAKHVIGVEIDKHRLAFAKNTIARDYPQLIGRVDLMLVDDFQGGSFDAILSKDSFEHISDPETYVGNLQRCLKGGGVFAVGFRSLWKSPYGGHMSFMTKLPWAHLIFPERTIMAERRRFFPEDRAEAFEQIPGGLNRMTLSRFLTIMQSTGLKREYLRTNVSNTKAAVVCRTMAIAPFLREYFTYNAYGIWRKAA